MPSYSLSTLASKTNVKKPKEITSFSRNSDYSITQDDNQLKYFYFPDQFLSDPRGYALTGGFEDFKRHILEKPLDYGDFTGLLQAIEKEERKSGKKISAKLVTWRGLVRQLMMLPFQNRDKFVFNILPFDDQLFMQSDIEFQQEKKGKENWDDRSIMGMYSGYKFETLTTMNKSWAAMDRKDIESRINASVDTAEQYSTVVRTTIGKTSLVLGAEVDCVWDWKAQDDPLQHYVELKCTRVVDNPKEYFKFENKLLQAWAQSFLIGVPKIVYGFRDDDFILRAIEEYETEKVPILLKQNPMNEEKQRQNPNFKVTNKPMVVLKFICGLLDWISDEIDETDESKSYRLEYDPSVNKLYINLSTNTTEKTQHLRSTYNGAQGGILTEEFKNWRKELKEKN
ncbi:decapping nuclease [Martiniozyma asiatica (nom. inval.)]|nr:decapping nuclease [Martiniozyma asiatica]